jgi:hypothetical protein
VLCCNVDPIAHREVYKPVTIGFHAGKSSATVVEARSSFSPAEAARIWRLIVQVAACAAPPAHRSQSRAKVPLCKRRD